MESKLAVILIFSVFVVGIILGSLNNLGVGMASRPVPNPGGDGASNPCPIGEYSTQHCCGTKCQTFCIGNGNIPRLSCSITNNPQCKQCRSGSYPGDCFRCWT